MSRAAVFLDRDGTINREIDYLGDPERFELLPGAGEALARLARAGYALVVTTNQSGIARGLFGEPELAAVHARMSEELARFGVTLDALEWCPHHPDVGAPPYRRECACRKPLPGMLIRAAERLDLDPARSWTVGDALRDLEAGRVLGTRLVLVRTGKGRAEEGRVGEGVVVVDDLAGAADWILAEGEAGSPGGSREG